LAKSSAKPREDQQGRHFKTVQHPVSVLWGTRGRFLRCLHETDSKRVSTAGTLPAERGGLNMNWSMYTADRTTHLKIVVVGLVAALLISVIGISARNLNLGTDIMTAQAPTVIKAGGPIAFSTRDGTVIR